MNAFDEFARIAQILQQKGVPYAVVGGVALAFHGHPRFTQDIDLIVMKEDVSNLTTTLLAVGYKSFVKPWKLGNTDLVLHRFLKASENEMILDVLEGSTGHIREMISKSLTASGSEGDIKVARKEDLILLKRMRNSLQDQADIEKLSNEMS